jgi:hypothetical protein
MEESFLKSGGNSIPKGLECKLKTGWGEEARKEVLWILSEDFPESTSRIERSIQDSAPIRLTAFAGTV